MPQIVIRPIDVSSFQGDFPFCGREVISIKHISKNSSDGLLTSSDRSGWVWSSSGTYVSSAQPSLTSTSGLPRSFSVLAIGYPL